MWRLKIKSAEDRGGPHYSSVSGLSARSWQNSFCINERAMSRSSFRGVILIYVIPNSRIPVFPTPPLALIPREQASSLRSGGRSNFKGLVRRKRES
ncbi:hypothetical protein CDAR_517951 [Caerostris darwini]|uniref:Uncharacterized protein n=1 Tax=Caerostris darwini TaxID=1538125 RepID=A0AAV4QRN3_9ARAC|nr:hypothetical protein CDAR_517951 [Caerostris darwini]